MSETAIYGVLARAAHRRNQWRIVVRVSKCAGAAALTVVIGFAVGYFTAVWH